MTRPALSAKWIGPPNTPNSDYGLFEFRAQFVNHSPTQSHDILISADQRYKLFVNGHRVGMGPQRGDLDHWFVDSYDLAQYCVEGLNEIKVLVWSQGRFAPMAQISARTGLMVEDLGGVGALTTPGSWTIQRIPQCEFVAQANFKGEFYIDVGLNESWNLRDAMKSEEMQPHVICDAEWRGETKGGTPWKLVQRSIPPMREEVWGAQPKIYTRIAHEHSITDLPIQLGEGHGALLDFGELINAYPSLTFEPTGHNPRVEITYAEALVDDQNEKGNRNQIDGKSLPYAYDSLILGAEPFCFEPNWWRTFRFIEVKGQDVVLNRVQAVTSGYPMSVQSEFHGDDPDLDQIWLASLRTLKLCAGETYFDCPYYEQLQYIGDARIQALCGYYLSRDRSLQRSAIETLSWSVDESGLLQSRYPSRQSQFIPPFSLWWVLMVYDAWMHDPEFDLDRYLPICWGVIRGFWNLTESSQAGSGEMWCFGDWVPGWRWGVPPGGIHSSMHQLTLALAETALGKMDPRFEAPAVPEVELDSEHAHALHRLIQAEKFQEFDPWPDQFPEGLPRSTYYFQWYSHLAQLPQDYIELLQPWRDMLSLGLTTFAENPEPTRSDCHAWSSHPAMGMLRFIAGISSAAPGWSRVFIEPQPGRLTKFSARLDHPHGELSVKFDAGTYEIVSPVLGQIILPNRDIYELIPGVHLTCK